MNHDDLNEQIREALDFETSPEQLARLERFWHQRSRAERRRRRSFRLAALAASVLIVASVSIWFWRQGPGQHAQQAEQAAPVVPFLPEREGGAPPQIAGVERTRGEADGQSIGRPPTDYERLMFTAYARRQSASLSRSVTRAFDDALTRMTVDPEADPQELIEAVGIPTDKVETLALRRLRRSTDEEKHAILQLLSDFGTSKSAGPLLNLGRRSAFRDQALSTIEQIVGLDGVAAAVKQSPDRRVRAALLQRLLTAESERAMRDYLSLVHDDALRGETLAAADALPEPPLRSLFALLTDEDKDTRMAAALVLGHVNGPEVTRSLIELVSEEPGGPSEAWIALLACRGELAHEFLAYATHEPQLLGKVNNARVQWARMVP